MWAAADALRAWIEHYGVPRALYVDWKNLYKRGATPGERLRGEEPITQFGRMCERLGIELDRERVHRRRKGRVERMHGTHQDRLVKKLRRMEIATHARANAYLEAEYLPEHNRRFARAAARPEDYHGRKPSGAGVGPGLPVGDGTDDRCRLGGALRQPIFATSAGEASACPREGSREGLRKSEGRVDDRIRGPKGEVGGDPGDEPKPEAGAERTRPARRRPSPTPAAGGVGAGGRPSLASAGLPGRGRVAPDGRAQGAALAVGLTLRFALSAPPFGLRRASLRASPTASKKRESTAKNKKGTFLTR